ncbi:DUF4249 domain-containing protein [Pedobacter sp.]|uniref:DUF4249 domain-containing protein n=1 Tax=Pedobacter sp. TaxID=1411316 RepID=UPI00396CB8D5
MMDKKYTLNPAFLLIAFLFLLTGCEDVITLKLDEPGDQYVIEAQITDQLKGAQVALSKVKNFNADNSFNGQSGALVSIEDESGTPYILTETSTKGIYRNDLLKGAPSKAYKLKVQIAGKAFTATCIMPQKVVAQNAFAFELSLFDGPRLFTHVTYLDPADRENYYRFLEYVNGVYTKNITVTNDEFTNGKLVKQMLWPNEFTEETKLKKGDEVKVEFLNIDKNIFKYWKSVKDGALGSSGNASPVNPVSNISGGAIGYFSAHTMQSITYTVK